METAPRPGHGQTLVFHSPSSLNNSTSSGNTALASLAPMMLRRAGAIQIEMINGWRI